MNYSVFYSNITFQQQSQLKLYLIIIKYSVFMLTFQYLIKNSLLVHPSPSQTILDHTRPSKTILNQPKPSQTILDYPQLFQTILSRSPLRCAILRIFYIFYQNFNLLCRSNISKQHFLFDYQNLVGVLFAVINLTQFTSSIFLASVLWNYLLSVICILLFHQPQS